MPQHTQPRQRDRASDLREDMCPVTMGLLARGEFGATYEHSGPIYSKLHDGQRNGRMRAYGTAACC